MLSCPLQKVPREPECIIQGTWLLVCVWVWIRGPPELKTARREVMD